MILHPPPTFPGITCFSGTANCRSSQGWQCSLGLARMRVAPGSDSLDRSMRASGEIGPWLVVDSGRAAVVVEVKLHRGLTWKLKGCVNVALLFVVQINPFQDIFKDTETCGCEQQEPRTATKCSLYSPRGGREPLQNMINNPMWSVNVSAYRHHACQEELMVGRMASSQTGRIGSYEQDLPRSVRVSWLEYLREFPTAPGSIWIWCNAFLGCVGYRLTHPVHLGYTSLSGVHRAEQKAKGIKYGVCNSVAHEPASDKEGEIWKTGGSWLAVRSSADMYLLRIISQLRALWAGKVLLCSIDMVKTRSRHRWGRVLVSTYAVPRCGTGAQWWPT